VILSYEELYAERKERLDCTSRLREPDRVPILGNFGFFSAVYAEITHYEFMYDYEKASKAIVKTAVDFGFDTAGSISGLGALPFTLAFLKESSSLVSSWVSGPVHDILGVKYARFPGRELDSNLPFQFIGEEYMKVDEYDELIEDPSSFIAEKLLPRSCRSLENPGSIKAMLALIEWGAESQRGSEALKNLRTSLEKFGFPEFWTAFSYAPLDFIGDFLRDVKNVLLDIYRVPEKVKQACIALEPLIIEMGKIVAQSSPEGTRALIPLHLNEYFSPKKYNEFYWPTLKKVILELIDNNVTPYIFYEGYHDVHLETILELPKGKTISKFEKTDLRKAKDIIGEHSCIVAGPPSSLLISGTPLKIELFTKNLLEVLKPGGGFIVSPSVSIPATAKPENVKALFNAVKKYGKY
jgi:uroporphyrinogen-III decarboxylase